MIYYHKNGSTCSTRNQNTLQNTTHITASRIKSPSTSNQREARVSATPGRPKAACLTNSRRRMAKGLAPDLSHTKHLKSLTGQTTYATKNKRRPNRRHNRKIPTCLAISALTCCLCFFTSLSHAYVLNNPTNYPNTANKTPPVPTETKETKDKTPEANKGVKDTTGTAPMEKTGRRARAPPYTKCLFPLYRPFLRSISRL
jgi:hypothetical protein